MESIYPRRVPVMGNLTGNGWTVASQESVLSLIVVLGSSVSLVGLIFAFITYSLFSDLRTMSGTALMYMLANMFLTQLFYVVGVGGVQEDNLCLCLAFGIHYLRLAIISWLCVMTYDMLITFRNNVNLNPRPEPVNVLISRFVKYSLFAWGVPSLSVISASVMRVTINHQTVDNLNPYNCWFFEKTIYNVTFAMPALCCFAAIVDSLVRSWLTARATVGLQVDKKTRLKMHRKRTLQLHLYVKIATLLFAVNVFGYVARNGSPASDPVAWIAYNVGHSLQGILVALAVTCNCQVLKIYTRSFARRRRRRPRNGSATALFDKRDNDISDTTYLQNLTWDPVPLPV
ncbi:adhesion G protein-coupled receptor E3-like [Rhopalosiphum maidis]|uniref:adhesion G protein-coupled receptor E3-like n=1 Tax=Rhopalosiphum maidis TaxID=43146 RepID=UPI000EFEBC97|nr:adhesion G protein-coupled receptor E3-like [Rhopalosiphum maidis]XP_060841228.1 adhesion G protein-coupled receptor E3-like [Rhopalosiphum padi]